MKMSRGMTAAFLLAGTIGAPAAMIAALDQDSEDRRQSIEPPRYGPGTGKVPPEIEPTERDRARMAAAEEKRARRRARNLRNLT